MKKILFGLASLFLFAVLALYMNQDRDIKAGLDLGASSSMDDIRITQKKSGVVSWILDAKKAVFVSETDVKLAGLRIEFPEKELTLTSDGGLYDIENRDLKIDGNISASTKNYDILASTLSWDSSKNEVVSDRKVRIVGKKFTVEGDNLAACGNKAKLSRNVRAVFDGK